MTRNRKLQKEDFKIIINYISSIYNLVRGPMSEIKSES